MNQEMVQSLRALEEVSALLASLPDDGEDLTEVEGIEEPDPASTT